MQKENNLIQKVIGYILLSPALISVLLFFAGITKNQNDKSSVLSKLNDKWSSEFLSSGDNYGAMATSALPFYFGLMAIAGAYLIKDK